MVSDTHFKALLNSSAKLNWIVLLGFGFCCFSACETAPESVVLEQFDEALEITILPDLEYSDSAVLKMRLKGPSLHYYRDNSDPRQEFPDGIHVEFYNGDGQLSGVLEGKYGIRFERSKSAIVRDSVVYKSVDGQVLETSELFWDEKTERIHTNKFFVLTGPGEIQMGQGFDANQDFTDIKFYSTNGEKEYEEKDEPATTKIIPEQ